MHWVCVYIVSDTAVGIDNILYNYSSHGPPKTTGDFSFADIAESTPLNGPLGS